MERYLMKLEENELYFYDADAAEKPIKWIERYLVHDEGRYSGLPFKLMEWQKQIIRDLFGWKRRSDRFRRFRECYIEIAKGNGKSPFITAIGMYIFVMEPGRSKQLYSIATTFKQATITFDAAKKFLKVSPRLADLLVPKQYSIENPETDSKWEIFSGDAEGKHGFRPDFVAGDEVHEWDNRKLYDNVGSNMFKRAGSLMVLATNAGSSRNTICWELHERAMRVLDRKSKDDQLYPVIFSASKTDKISSEKVWAKANPSLGHTILLDDLRSEYVKATENPPLMARFKRLNLSIWTAGAAKYINMDQWDRATKRPSIKLEGLPCQLSLDLSGNDDFSSIAATFQDHGNLICKAWTFVPAMSARKYQDEYSIPIDQWANDKHLKILQQETVDDDALKRMEKFIIKLTEKYNVKSVAYDPARAHLLINRLEKQGITCIPITQGFGLGSAMEELTRRLKAGTIKLPDNPCLRWQAENLEAEAGNYGAVRPVKEANKGQYAGRRSAKIDAIVAIVTGIAEILRSGSADDALSQWDGKIHFA